MDVEAVKEMKKPKRVRRKARFRVGEVIAKCIHFAGERKPWVYGYGAVEKHEPREDTDGYLLDGGWWYVDTMSAGTRMYLRSLTRRERGQ